MNGKYIILIRHGERQHRLPKDQDFLEPLTERGRRETCQLKRRLAFYGFGPEVFFTSRYAHASEAGALLAERGVPVIQLNCLRPGGPMDKLKQIVTAAHRRGPRLDSYRMIAFVGHEPSLSQLLTRLTSKRFRPLNRAEAVCVEARSWEDFLQGQGKVRTRIPIVDYQEEQLRSKISSKLSVATFLAGFTFAALIEVLMQIRLSVCHLFRE